MAYRKVGCVGCVVGAEALSDHTGVWVKTRFYRDGDFLCATVYSVAAGEPMVAELRVDIRPIARAVLRAHSALHARELAQASVRGRRSGATVGWSLGSLWKGAKKVAQKIGRSRLVKGVTGVVMKVARNKAFQVAMPFAALAAHTSSKALGGKGAFKGALGSAVNLGTGAVLSSIPGGAVARGISASPLMAQVSSDAIGAYAAANAAVAGVEKGRQVVRVAQAAQSRLRTGAMLARQVTIAKTNTAAMVKRAGAGMTPAARAAIVQRAAAAGKLALNAQGKAVVSNALANATTARKATVARALATKLRAMAELKRRAALAQALPAKAGAAVVAATRLEVAAGGKIRAAVATAKKLQDPKVRASLLAARAHATKAEALLQNVKAAAKTGGLDAQKSAVIVDLVARNRARIQAMSQANAGGLPGVLITQDGKLERGRFRLKGEAKAGGLLYLGAGEPKARGTFQTVSGVTLESIAVNGDLPLDGVRLASRGPNSNDIGPYEVGCGNTPCAPCAAANA